MEGFAGGGGGRGGYEGVKANGIVGEGINLDGPKPGRGAEPSSAGIGGWIGGARVNAGYGGGVGVGGTTMG